MYWLYDEETGCDYVFVYDDSDGSVEYVLYQKLKVLRIKCNRMRRFTDTNIAKMRMLGFRNVGTCYKMEFCRYMISDFRVYLRISILTTGTCTLHVMFSTDNGLKKLVCRPESEVYFSRHTMCMWTKKVNSTSYLKIKVPTDMVMYLLNMKLCKDFDGVMSCFDNLLGDRLNKIFKLPRAHELVFEEWS